MAGGRRYVTPPLKWADIGLIALGVVALIVVVLAIRSGSTAVSGAPGTATPGTGSTTLGAGASGTDTPGTGTPSPSKSTSPSKTPNRSRKRPVEFAESDATVRSIKAASRRAFQAWPGNHRNFTGRR